MFADLPVMQANSRESAIADGILIDVSGVACDAGFAAPVAITQGLWQDAVAWTDEDSRRAGRVQQQADRLWYLVRLAALYARVHTEAAFRFDVARVAAANTFRSAELVGVKLLHHVGDAGEPVITLMLEGEK